MILEWELSFVRWIIPYIWIYVYIYNNNNDNNNNDRYTQEIPGRYGIRGLWLYPYEEFPFPHSPVGVDWSSWNSSPCWNLRSTVRGWVLETNAETPQNEKNTAKYSNDAVLGSSFSIWSFWTFAFATCAYQGESIKLSCPQHTLLSETCIG